MMPTCTFPFLPTSGLSSCSHIFQHSSACTACETNFFFFLHCSHSSRVWALLLQTLTFCMVFIKEKKTKKQKNNQAHWVSSAVDIPSADSWSPAYYIPCSTDIVVMRNANFLVTKCCSKAPIHQKEKKIKKENKPLICASPQACEKLTNLIILKFRIIKIRIRCSYLPGLLPWNAVNLCQLGWLRKQFKKNYKNMCTSETVDHSVIHSMQSWN